MLDSLFDRLDELAPDYCYFGAHEGDGSDYGFWVGWGALDDAVHEGDVIKIDDWSQAIEAGTYLHVNERGNVTFAVVSSIQSKGSEVTQSNVLWSVV